MTVSKLRAGYSPQRTADTTCRERETLNKVPHTWRYGYIHLTWLSSGEGQEWRHWMEQFSGENGNWSPMIQHDDTNMHYQLRNGMTTISNGREGCALTINNELPPLNTALSFVNRDLTLL